MKICYLSSLYNESLWGGGVRTYLSIISTKLADLGHQVTILTSGSDYFASKNLTIVGLGNVDNFRSNNQLVNPLFYFRRLNYMFRAYMFIRKHHFDIVEAADGGFEHLFLVIKPPCKIITRMHGSTVDTKQVGLKRLIRLLERFCLDRSDGITAPSKSYAEYVLGPEKAKSIKVIPYGIELGKVKVGRNKSYRNKKMILFVGMLCQRKGVDYLIKVARALVFRVDIVFVVIGGNLENFDVSSFPKNVEYLGYMNRNQLNQYYRTCELLFVPSRFETFGINVLEAMKYGKPIVAARVVGLKDVVRHNRNGFLFDHQDLDYVIDKILNLVDNYKFRKKFGEESLKLVKKYNINWVGKETVKFYLQKVNKSENFESRKE